MLMGAFFGAWGADITGSWILGIVIAIAAGAVFGALHALFAVTFRADQIVSGTALNLLAVGITGYLYVEIYGDRGHAGRPAAGARRHAADQVGPAARGRLRRSSTCWSGSRSRWSLVTWVVVFRTPIGPAAAVGGREPAGGRDGRPVRSSARATWP